MRVSDKMLGFGDKNMKLTAIIPENYLTTLQKPIRKLIRILKIKLTGKQRYQRNYILTRKWPGIQTGNCLVH